MLLCLAPFLAGVLGLWLISQDNPYGRLACLWISFAYTAAWSLAMSVATANTAGHTKKITTNALLIIGYCLGNFVGPFFFKKSQAPTYGLGVAMMLFCVGLQIVCLLSLWVLLWMRNRSRRHMHLDSPENEAEAHERGLADQTDKENKYFKVSDVSSILFNDMSLIVVSMCIKHMVTSRLIDLVHLTRVSEKSSGDPLLAFEITNNTSSMPSVHTCILFPNISIIYTLHIVKTKPFVQQKQLDKFNSQDRGDG